MSRPTRLTLGIDEAGRGPALGPMVMAAVTLDTRAARALTRAGLRDSKSYGAGADARARRAALAGKVHELSICAVVVVLPVATIDARVARKQLNHLERETAQHMIEQSPPVTAIIADGKNLFGALARQYPHLTAVNQAESRHAAVAAASVLAKHRRDQIFGDICAAYRDEFGEIRGGGYVNEGTRSFLRAYAERYRKLPPEARRSWPHDYLAGLLDPEPGVASEGQLSLF